MPLIYPMLGVLWLALIAPSSAASEEEEQWPCPFEDLSNIPGLRIQLAYKTDANFTGQAVYSADARAWADGRVARALEKAEAKLASQGYHLVIYDAYRPARAVKEMWKLAKRKKLDLVYLADPAHGSDHSRGAAVDVGLIRASGRAVSMPCAYDFIGAAASHEDKGATEQQTAHREILKKAMGTSGFLVCRAEWWHYVLPSARTNPISNFEP